MKTDFPVVEIVWDDAATEMGWDVRPTAAEPQLCLSLGFLVFENEKYVILASTVSGDHVNSKIQIPRGMIQSMREMNVTVKRKRKEKLNDASGKV